MMIDVQQMLSALSSLDHESVTNNFVIAQFVALFIVAFFTWRPLILSSWRLRSIRKGLRKLRENDMDFEKAQKLADRDPKTARAWIQSIGAQQDKSRKFDALEPEIAFEPARLLPFKYHVRLDGAAPGLFTAFGIIGTFVGLLIGFMGINPAEATESIGGLIGGMTVAFVNSVVGVSLSIIWSFSSRVLRHYFDVSASKLQEEAEEWFDWRGVGYELSTGLAAVVAKLQEISGGLVNLRESSEESSKTLLDGISPKLAESMKVLVTTPFEQLTESVAAFDEMMKKAGEHQLVVAQELAESTASLAATKAALVESLATAQQCVVEFQASAERLREGTEETAEIVQQTASASAALTDAAAETRAASDRYGELGSALQATISVLESTDEALRDNATRFQSSAEHLERTVADVRKLADEGVTQSVGAVRGELQSAIEALTGEIAAELGALTARFPEQVQELSVLLEKTHSRTIEAYQGSSEQVIEAVDERLSDLTDRLHGALATLTSRLPEEVSTVTQAMMQTSKQVRSSTRSMDDALRQLAVQTPQALAAQYKEFDTNLAKAMKHFSGTLLGWEDKINDLHRLAAALEAFIELLEREHAKQGSGTGKATEVVRT